MKRLLALAALGAAVGCIDWSSVETQARAQRCVVAPSDPGCPDASVGGGSGGGSGGGGGGGFVDGGADGGGGVDAGLVASDVTNFAFEAIRLAGDDGALTLVGVESPSVLHLEGVALDGGGFVTFTEDPTTRPTAAFERDHTLAVAFDDHRVFVWHHAETTFDRLTTQTLNDVASAIDLNAREDGGLAIAAYGAAGYGIGVTSFTTGGAAAYGPGAIGCAQLGAAPQRASPVPGAPLGVVVGTVQGACDAPLDQSTASGFVLRFDTTGTSGTRFDSELGPMALGLVRGTLWLAWRSSPSTLSLGRVSPTGDSLTSAATILSGDSITPVDLVEGPDGSLYVVGFTAAAVGLPGAGTHLTPDGQDVFIARVSASQTVDHLDLYVEPGNQDVVGAVVANGRLFVAGNCTSGAFCLTGSGARAWLASFAP